MRKDRRKKDLAKGAGSGEAAAAATTGCGLLVGHFGSLRN